MIANYCPSINYNLSYPCEPFLELQHIVLPALENGNILEALEETLLLFSKLPAELWNRGVMNLLPELVIILDDMSCDKVTVKVFLSILEMCPTSDGRALLEAKLRPSSKD